jgi:antitoxin ParD1/3/4
MELTLGMESEEMIQRKLESGAYPSAEDVVVAALKLLEDRDNHELSILREEIAIGVEQADRGDLIDGEDVFLEIRNRISDDRIS